MRTALLLFVWWLFAPALFIFRKVYCAGAAAGLFLAAMTIPAFAADSTTVSIPIGEWITAAVGVIRDLVVPIVIIVVGWAMRILPSAIAAYLKMLQVDQLLARAIGYGLAAVPGAVAGQTLTVDVGNRVLAQALAYAVEHAPDLVAWAGGSASLRQKIIARLPVAADAYVATVGGAPKLA